MGAAEGQFPKVDGDILYGSEINEFNIPTFNLYEASGIDVSNSASSWTQATAEIELTAITLTNNRTHIKVGYLGILAKTGGTTNMDLNFYIKEIGQSYSLIKKFEPNGTTGEMYNEFIYPLTSGMKTNGFQIKIETDTQYSGGFGEQSAFFTNEQIKVEFF